MTEPVPTPIAPAPSPRTDDASFSPVDVERDRALLAAWFEAEHVAPWWAVAGAEAYLADALAAEHQRSWLVGDRAGAYGYVESYRAADDALAEHVAIHNDDRGWHVLIGEQDRQGTGAADRLAAATICGLFAEPGVQRVLCEPDVRNVRMLRFCTRNGGRIEEEFDFGGRKRAALVTWSRAEAAARWPRELAEAEAAARRWDALDRAVGDTPAVAVVASAAQMDVVEGAPRPDA